MTARDALPSNSTVRLVVGEFLPGFVSVLSPKDDDKENNTKDVLGHEADGLMVVAFMSLTGAATLLSNAYTCLLFVCLLALPSSFFFLCQLGLMLLINAVSDSFIDCLLFNVFVFLYIEAMN